KQENQPLPPLIDGDENLFGQIKVVALSDGQLQASDLGLFLQQADSYFKGGLKALLIDLRKLTTISSSELKTIIQMAKNNLASVLFLVDPSQQKALMRIFQILNLDRYLKFFPTEKDAENFINQSN
ncbi:MAG: STAS domain-containing protein, partial [Candidatus Adiutrix sp.]